MKDPLNNPSLVWRGAKLAIRGIFGLNVKPKMTLHLSEEVHPSLQVNCMHIVLFVFFKVQYIVNTKT